VFVGAVLAGRRITTVLTSAVAFPPHSPSRPHYFPCTERHAQRKAGGGAGGGRPAPPSEPSELIASVCTSPCLA
jgi:hypothetical protein